MDPNANLDEQLAIAKRMLSGVIDSNDAARLAELVESLDYWITGGGFVPVRWQRPTDAIGRPLKG